MIAILGGTFDPIHKGHIHIAARVLQQLPVEQIQFMPCARPVHRNLPRASAEQRCDMIELAIGERPGFELNRLEIERGGPSFSIDSLREMHQRGFSRLALILGSDSFASFSTWKAPDEIRQLAQLIVCRRPGDYAEPNVPDAQRVESADQFENEQAGAIMMLDVQAPDCASSKLRAQIAAGENTSDCLDLAVAEYIERHGLYRKEHA